MERRTSRITRRQSSLADQEPPTTRHWYDANNGIFIQRKPQAHVKNDWDDDLKLVLSQVSQARQGFLRQCIATSAPTFANFVQNGSKPYTVQVDEGETVELRLMCNSNFWVMPVPKDGPGANSGINEDGLPTSHSSFYYYDLFLLTAEHGGLGVLKEPGLWTFNLFFDKGTGALLVAANCRRWGYPARKERLTVRLWVEKEKHLFLKVDLDKLEETAPGARKEQEDHISGRADRRRTEFLRKQRQSESRTQTPAMDRTESELQPEAGHEPEPQVEVEPGPEVRPEDSSPAEAAPEPPRRGLRRRLPPLRPGPGWN